MLLTSVDHAVQKTQLTMHASVIIPSLGRAHVRRACRFSSSRQHNRRPAVYAKPAVEEGAELAATKLGIFTVRFNAVAHSGKPRTDASDAEGHESTVVAPLRPARAMLPAAAAEHRASWCMLGRKPSTKGAEIPFAHSASDDDVSLPHATVTMRAVG